MEIFLKLRYSFFIIFILLYFVVAQSQEMIDPSQSPSTNQQTLPPDSVIQQLKDLQNTRIENKKSTVENKEIKKNQEEKEEKTEEKEKESKYITEKAELEESDIENNLNKIYSDVLKDKKLKQFGYDFFKGSKKALSPVGDDYILGPGDNLKVFLWGDPVDILSLDREVSLEVSRDGTVYIPNVGVLNVAGLKIGDFKKILTQRLSSKYKNLKVDVVLEKLRTFKVYTTGFVKNPGVILVNPLDNLIDALTLAGGVSKNGSLRNIEIKRKTPDGIITYKVDLYDLFIKGLPVDVKLRDEDVIYVPPIGDTVAIAGDVKRPAIYELKDEKTLEDVIKFAGGFNPSVSEVFVRLSRFSKDGVKIFEGSLSDKDFIKTKLLNGDFVFFGQKPSVMENAILVKGEVYYPGYYSTNDTKTLKELIDKAKPLVNAEIVQIIRENKETFSTKIKDIIENKLDIDLNSKDTVIFYKKYLSEPIYVFGYVKQSQTVPYYPNIRLLDVLRDVEFKEDIRRLKAIVIKNKELEKIKRKTNELESLKEEDLIGLNYDTVYLYDLLVKYDESKNVNLYPGDTVVILKTTRSEKAPSVTILGEVKNPGKYEIDRSTTLADVIKKAGGYTENAYPQGLIFIRDTIKKLQKEKLETTMSLLEEEFIKSTRQVSFATEEEKQAALMAIQEQKNLIQLMRKKAEFGLGRIALDIPPTLQELEKSNQNIVLEDGDTVIVPSRPSYILVLGDVYNQIAFPYVKGYRLKDYLEMVGGVGKNADKKNIYIIKANGRVVSSQSVGRSFLLWSGLEDYQLSEGDTIVVPTELKIPIAWRPMIKDIVQIIFQSISTAVLAKRL
ncbi:MAG: SLBB domain-containing protein [Sulfurihydrogenibium azorense]